MSRELHVSWEAYRGELSPGQIERLDEILVSHGEPPSTPHSVPEKVAFVCLRCGSIGVSESSEQRDLHVRDFDLTCCGLTVLFRSDLATLVDPSKLAVVPRPERSSGGASDE